MANESQRGTEDLRQQRHESRTSSTFMDFVRDLCAQGNWSEEEAIRNAASVLTRLEQRLTGEEASNLAAQLPFKLQEILAEAGRPASGKPIEKFHKGDYVAAIARDLGKSADQAETIIRNVFTAVRSRVSEGEAGDVESQLPKDLKPLWARPI